MKRTGSLLVILTFVALHFMPSVADARLGGGRSFGSRGSRGMAAPRTYRSAPSTPPRGSYGAPYRSPSAPPYTPPMASSGGWMRSLGAGIAGGFLGSMLFRGLGHAGGYGGYGYGGGGGIGFLDILLLAGIAYLVYRLVRGRRQFQTAGGPDSGYSSYSTYGNEPRDVSPYAQPQEATYLGGEEDAVEVLQRHDPQFDADRFRDERLDDFFKLQAAFGNRDISPVRDRLTPEMASQIDQDLAALRSAGRINRLDNIAVRNVEPAEAWHEAGKVFATVRYQANLVDYTLDEKSGDVVAGSRTEPVKFNELWTYVKDVGFGAQYPRWRLTAIEQEST